MPEGPGLGVSLDRDALERWKRATRDPYPRALVRVQYEGIPAFYARVPIGNLGGSDVLDAFRGRVRSAGRHGLLGRRRVAGLRRPVGPHSGGHDHEGPSPGAGIGGGL